MFCCSYSMRSIRHGPTAVVTRALLLTPPCLHAGLSSSQVLRDDGAVRVNSFHLKIWHYNFSSYKKRKRHTRCHKAAAFDCTGVWQLQQGKEKGKNDKEAGNQTSTGTEMCLTHWDTLHQTATFAFLKTVFLNIPIYYLSSDWYQD